MAQLVYVNSAEVAQPGATRALFTTQALTGFTGTTPAVSANGVMYLADGGIMWSVPPNGQAVSVFGGMPDQKTGCEFLPSVNETSLPLCQVGSPTIGPNGTLYFTAGDQPPTAQAGMGAAYALDPASGQQQWSLSCRKRCSARSPWTARATPI